MKIIIPMAGRGSRLRPHTLTVPKPLIPVAGKPMVQRIVEDLASGYDGQVEEVAFIIGDFGAEVEKELIGIAERLGAKGKIYYQDKPLGVAHAILCAKESLQGNVFLAFSDTLFKADFHFDKNQDGVIWVKTVEDPSSFGVVKTDGQQIITDFVEKSPVFVSDLAIVGLYYVREGEFLRQQIQQLIDNNIKDKGEFQITSVLENMKAAGYKFKAQTIDEWLDCGNKQNIVDTNRRILQIKSKTEQLRHPTAVIENSVIIEPCFIGRGTKITNSVIGPYVSIGHQSSIDNSNIKNSVIQDNTVVENAMFDNSMIGNKVKYEGRVSDISIGDFTHFKE
ncbi:MAG TPA: nucleotidyltransferase [Bacteroidetes bacterium]|nr:nucleotidyltransferase [Bacteroidota bacterium]